MVILKINRLLLLILLFCDDMFKGNPASFSFHFTVNNSYLSPKSADINHQRFRAGWHIEHSPAHYKFCSTCYIFGN